MENYFDQKMKTKHGIDKLTVMLKFMSIVEPGTSKVKNNFNRFKSFICQQMKRGMTLQEETNLMEGIVKYLHSEEQTNERFEAMDYIFELKFLND